MNSRSLFLFAVVAACGGISLEDGGTAGGGGATAGGSGGTGGGTSMMTLDCSSACNAKAADCGAPAGQGAQFCSGWCTRNPTDAQIQCLQSSSCQALMQPAPCGVSGAGGGGGGGSGSTAGGGGSAGGRAGGSGGTGGGSPFQCAGQTCRSSSACCSFAPYCSPDSSSCTLQCKADGQNCFFDSECCNLGCDRNTSKCTSCKPGGAACGNANNNIACCGGPCTNGTCPMCRGPGEICVVNADCCASSYCNSGKCFRRLADGGIP